MPKCHLCELSSEQRDLSSEQIKKKVFLAMCCVRRCNKNYCLKCINTRFDQSFSQRLYRSDTWICYSCQSLCPCIICKGLHHQKKNNKKKNKDLNQKSQRKIPINANQNQKKLMDYFSHQQITAVSPFMKRILTRKNMIYRMIAQHPDHPHNQKLKNPSKQYNPSSIQIEGQGIQREGSKMQEQIINQQQRSCSIAKDQKSKKPQNLQKLISQTMKAYEDDDEQMDIQLL